MHCCSSLYTVTELEPAPRNGDTNKLQWGGCGSPRLTALTRLFSTDCLKQIQILGGNNSPSSCDDEIIVTFLHCG